MGPAIGSEDPDDGLIFKKKDSLLIVVKQRGGKKEVVYAQSPLKESFFCRGGAGSACQTGDLPPRALKNKLPNPSN